MQIPQLFELFTLKLFDSITICFELKYLYSHMAGIVQQNDILTPFKIAMKELTYPVIQRLQYL